MSNRSEGLQLDRVKCGRNTITEESRSFYVCTCGNEAKDTDEWYKLDRIDSETGHQVKIYGNFNFLDISKIFFFFFSYENANFAI